MEKGYRGSVTETMQKKHQAPTAGKLQTPNNRNFRTGRLVVGA
jgi:hypothetical protein